MFYYQCPFAFFKYVYSSETGEEQSRNSLPVKKSCIRRSVRVNIRLVYILLFTFIVLEKKELIGSFSLSLIHPFIVHFSSQANEQKQAQETKHF